MINVSFGQAKFMALKVTCTRASARMINLIFDQREPDLQKFRSSCLTYFNSSLYKKKKSPSNAERKMNTSNMKKEKREREFEETF